MPTKDQQSIRDAHPNAWIALEQGDRLAGKVVEVRRAWSDQRARNGDGFYPLLQIQTGDGATLDFHAFSTVSYNRVIELRPRPGEQIVVTFTGLGKKKEGQNAPKLFTVVLPDRDPVAQADSVYDSFGDARNNAQPAPDPVRVDTDDIPF